MTTEEKGAEAPVVDVKQELPEGNATQAPKVKSVEEAEAKLAELTAELEKNAELLKKVRKFERENKEAAEKALQEQGKFKELYEAEVARRSELENTMKLKAIDTVLNEALATAKAKSIQTVMKLVDRSKVEFNEKGEVETKSLEKLIKELKVSDPILFEEEKSDVPPVKRAGEGDVVGGYEKEIRAARSQKEIEAVMRKYGKMG